MSSKAELEILKIYKGKSIKNALYALSIMEKHVEHNKLNQRIKLRGLIIGE